MKYRYKPGVFAGFYVYKKYRYLPFWLEVGWFASLQQAKEYVENGETL